MIFSPCKNCSDRILHCHSSCERYKQYRDILDKRKSEKAAENEEKAFHDDVKKAVKRAAAHKRSNDKRRK